MSETVQTIRYEKIEGAEISVNHDNYLDSLAESVQPTETDLLGQNDDKVADDVIQLRTPESVAAYAKSVSESVYIMREQVLGNVA